MLANEHLTRQLDLIPTKVLGEQVTIIGAGAIGGWTTLALAKMGMDRISVWDDDIVSIENMNSQFYRLGDIGKPKVKALQALVRDFTGITIEVQEKRYERGAFTGLVISAVDSMAARRAIWENHAKTAYGTRAIIDPRMGAESAALYVMNPMSLEDCTAYPKTLFTDEEGIQERCTAKATIYTANLVSGLVAKAVKDLITSVDTSGTTPISGTKAEPSRYLRVCLWNIAKNNLQAWEKPQRTVQYKASKYGFVLLCQGKMIVRYRRDTNSLRIWQRGLKPDLAQAALTRFFQLAELPNAGKLNAYTGWAGETYLRFGTKTVNGLRLQVTPALQGIKLPDGAK